MADNTKPHQEGRKAWPEPDTLALASLIALPALKSLQKKTATVLRAAQQRKRSRMTRTLVLPHTRAGSTNAGEPKLFPCAAPAPLLHVTILCHYLRFSCPFLQCQQPRFPEPDPHNLQLGSRFKLTYPCQSFHVCREPGQAVRARVDHRRLQNKIWPVK